MNTTDTPRTDAASFSSRDPLELMKTSQQLERELNESNRLKNLALSRMDDALEKAERLSTPDCHICHNKCQRPLCILSKELAASKAEVERLTEKLTSLQEAYLQSVERDNSLTKELFDSRAEVERLQSGMQGSCYCCEPVGILNQELEAEVAFWKSKAYEAEEQEGKREMEVEKLKELVKWYESRHSTIIST